MKPFDLSTLYRTGVGFDRLSQLFDEAMRLGDQGGYPPYNVELVGEDQYVISVALAGFNQNEISIETENGMLKIAGRKEKNDSSRTYLHRGIAERDFELRFHLAEHVKAVGAKMDNGLLSVDLIREIPEAMKPRKIEIGGGDVQWTESRKAPEQLESRQDSQTVDNQSKIKDRKKEPVAA